jgi:hypothetical protein
MGLHGPRLVYTPELDYYYPESDLGTLQLTRLLLRHLQGGHFLVDVLIVRVLEVLEVLKVLEVIDLQSVKGRQPVTT